MRNFFFVGVTSLLVLNGCVEEGSEVASPGTVDVSPGEMCERMFGAPAENTGLAA